VSNVRSFDFVLDENDNNTFHASRKFTLIPFNEITVGSTAVYLIKDIIPRTGLVVIWGPPKCGKSFWTLDLFMHIALGWEYRGRRTKQGGVVYLAPEGGKGFGGRVEAFRRHHQLAAGQSAPFFLVPAPINLVKDSKALIESIPCSPVAVIIDTLNRSLVGSESDDKDMAAYIKAADAIGEAFGCVVSIVHHCGIEGTRPRGHTSLTGVEDDPPVISRRHGDALPSAIHLGIVFANRAPRCRSP
jgi:RecA-family ATPase